MRRILVMSLVASLVLLGTGALHALHAIEHHAAAHDASTGDSHDHEPPPGAPDQSHSDCDLCLQLQSPMIPGETGAAIISHALTETSRPISSTARHALDPESIDCRGPPAPALVA